MKKYLMMACAALAIVSCSKTDDVSDSSRSKVEDTYKAAFLKYVGGSIASNQTWGFSSNAYTRGMAFTRSEAAPAVAEITAPYDEAWVATYCETATEPNSTNVADNYDNTTYATNYGDGGVNSIDWNDPAQVADRKYFFGEDGNTDTWEQRVQWALANHPTWVTYTKDADYVLNFKITGTWEGSINVVATEGLTDGVANGCERTVVVTGTWNLTDDQRVGSLGRIIIAKGGKLNITSGKQLQMVNQARLVVLQGGEINGGNIEVSNGNESGRENYNGGTINVAKFNNNFGKFFNYGTFIATEYDGGAQESNFYNHSLVKIANTGSSSNARIFNNCQWYCSGDMRARNYEGKGGSALIVDGQLMFSGSEDGTTDASYVGLAAGALVQCGTLYNNGTSWTGPTSGYAVLSMGKIVFLNWQQDAPETGGYFQNNIYAVADDWTNIPSGNGYQAGETATADYKFFHIVANCCGNGGVKKAEKGDSEIIPADDDFSKGVSGCTPGFKIKIDEPTADLRIIAEDLSASEASDFDFNDIVLDVIYGSPATLILQAAGGTLPLRIDGNDELEVHALFGVGISDMVNTGAGPSKPAVKIDASKFSKSITSAEQAADLLIQVKKDGAWHALTAVKGEPASKLAVDPSFKWLSERKSIKAEYPLFIDWASKANFTSKWW